MNKTYDVQNWLHQSSVYPTNPPIQTQVNFPPVNSLPASAELSNLASCSESSLQMSLDSGISVHDHSHGLVPVENSSSPAPFGPPPTYLSHLSVANGGSEYWDPDATDVNNASMLWQALRRDEQVIHCEPEVQTVLHRTPLSSLQLGNVVQSTPFKHDPRWNHINSDEAFLKSLDLSQTSQVDHSSFQSSCRLHFEEQATSFHHLNTDEYFENGIVAKPQPGFHICDVLELIQTELISDCNGQASFAEELRKQNLDKARGMMTVKSFETIPIWKKPKQVTSPRKYYTKQMKSNDDWYFYCIPSSSATNGISTTAIIGKCGGELALPDIQTSLVFPEGAVDSDAIEASLSTSFEEDYPPIRADQMVMSIVMRCGPPGQFKKYITLEVPHCANIDEDGLRKLQVWCRRSESSSLYKDADWELVFDEGEVIDPGIKITLFAEKLLIYTSHFSEFANQYAGPTDRTVLMFIKFASFKLDQVYLKVLVLLKEKVKTACEAEKADGWSVCSVSETGTSFKVLNNENPLKVRVWNVAPASHWCTTDLDQNDYIPYEYLQKGSAKLEFSFNKKRRNASKIRGVFNVTQEGNTFIVPDSHFDSGIVTLKEELPPTPGYTNPPSVGSLGYASASPGLSIENPGSILTLQPPSVESAPPSVKNHEREQTDSHDSFLEDVDLRRLAKKIGIEWEPLATHLGFSKSCIDQFRIDGTNRGIENVIFDVLVSWKQSQPKRSDLRKVLGDALIEAGRPDLANSISLENAGDNCSSQESFSLPPCKRFKKSPGDCDPQAGGDDERSTSIVADLGDNCSSQESFSLPPCKRFKKNPGDCDPQAGGDDVRSTSIAQEKAKIDQNVEDQIVKADAQGYYTDHHIKDAWPSSRDQVNPNTHYSMWGTAQKGQALVINISAFKDFNLVRSPGAEIDTINIVHLLKQLRYKVTERHDPTAQEMKRAVQNFAATCNQDVKCSSAIVVLMSYGNSNNIYGSDMKHIELAKIQKLMDCPRLKNKPKLMFYQACRFPSTSDHFLTSDEEEETTESGSGRGLLADMYMVYGIIEGQASLYKEQLGSWFIQGICEVFLGCAHEDSLEELMNKVKNHTTKMREQMTTTVYQDLATQQTPDIFDNLCRKFYFMPGYHVTFMHS